MSLTVKVPQKFTYETIQNFFDSYNQSLEKGEINTLILDFSEVETLDSSAMLKLVKLGHRAQHKDIVINVINLSAEMAEMLNLSSLERLGYTFSVK